MSKDWVADIKAMHEHYGIDRSIAKMDAATLAEFLEFRIKSLQEELTELKDATNPDDVIDALIDLAVFDIGTLIGLEVDAYDAWDRVLVANMNKKVGIKEGRPNPLGLPDLMKPEGWVAPTHVFNRSLLDFVYLHKWCDGKL